MRSIALLLLIGCAPQGIDGRPAWESLQRQLPGAWEGHTGAGKTIRLQFRMIANDSALVETFLSASGRETMTVYHPDGERLMLTHYCAQENQARLVASEATSDRVTFRLVEATNTLPERSVLSEMVLYLKPGELDRIERYRDSVGDIEEATVRFTRTSTQGS